MESMKGSNNIIKWFLWDFAVHGGAQDTDITIGSTPSGFVRTGHVVHTITPIVGVNATIDLGDGTTDLLHLDDVAITGFDTIGKTKTSVAALTDRAADLTTALRKVNVRFETAAVTAGCLAIGIVGNMPPDATGILADTSY